MLVHLRLITKKALIFSACYVFSLTDGFSQSVTSSATTFASTTPGGGGGISHWTTTANTSAQDDTYNTVSLAKSKTSYSFQATNFDFSSIPAGSTIDGILVEYDKFCSGPATASDNAIYIIKSDGSLGSTNKSSGAAWATTDSDSYDSYGGTSDLWGETWTLADIQDTDFGVSINASSAGSNGTYDFSIDHVRITVYYTAPVPYNYNSSTTTQSNTSNIAFCENDQEIIGLEIVIDGSTTPDLDLTELQINMNNTTDITDATNIEVFYTGTSSTYSATGSFGTATPAAGTITISGTQTLVAGTKLFLDCLRYENSYVH